MRTTTLCTLTLLLLALGTARAGVTDAPHSEAHGVFCSDCHAYSLWWQYSPMPPTDSSYAERTTIICLICHDGSGEPPFVETHSSDAMGAMHRQDIPAWSRTCTDCHNPHIQAQLNWNGEPGLYLVTGTMDTIVNSANSTTFSYANALTDKSQWADTLSWTQKTGINGRGLILAISDQQPGQTFEIQSVSEAVAIDPVLQTPGSGSMTVRGQIDPATYNGAGFGIIYGQLIKDKIIGVAGETFVKFFDAYGGFVDDNATGVCQVCHQQTLHFTATGPWPDSHADILGPGTSDTVRCTICHTHEVAFGHGSDGGSDCVGCHNSGKHVNHLNLDIICSTCHDMANVKGMDLLTTTVCATCHNDATGLCTGAAPQTVDYKDGWGVASGYPFTCDSCHQLPPSYANGTPKANSHAAHNYGCETCHYTTTLDGISLISGGTHTNCLYDISPAPGITATYTYNPTGGSCDSISCHNGGSATWGTTLNCLDCHGYPGSGGVGPDLDDFVWNNGIMARINQEEWTASGHGRSSAYPVSGNPGAAMACEYCHDDTISHGNGTNPFRLIAANITGDDGLNGICWVCHKTGSGGYDPADPSLPLVNSSAATKVDSYHYGARHGSGANNGGRFCWDCHDPHGDSNIMMIHEQVTTVADPQSGVPQATATVTFTNNVQETDFARTASPYDGICNVCHTNTGHYTSTSGDGHPVPDQVCTDCHHHSEALENEAFAQGDCLDCHNVVQDNGDGLPVGGRRAVVNEFPTDPHAHYGTTLDEGDCVVCHDQTSHMDGYVDLVDPDNSQMTYRFLNPGDLVADPDLSDFCGNCHDADGATRLSQSGSALDPFGSGNRPPDVASKFLGTLQTTEFYNDYCNGNEGTMRPVNSHHDISDADQSWSGAKLECLSCHGAHNVAQSQPLADPFNTSQSWTGTINGFCLACHGGQTGGPFDLGMPAGVNGPSFYTSPEPPSTPPGGIEPGTACGTAGTYDCRGVCLEFDLSAITNDGECNSGAATGADLRCAAFGFDGDDCQCEGTDCSSLGGIDSCQYDDQPWNIKFSWSNAPHGGGSKRGWPGYPTTGTTTYEMECVACHDPHGSYTASNPDGNPFMIRDVVDGTPFEDDGCRESRNNSCVQPFLGSGVNGTVEITGNVFNFAPLCTKCHTKWATEMNDVSHQSCTGSCLTCHAHGASIDATDHYLDDGVRNSLPYVCPQ